MSELSDLKTKQRQLQKDAMTVKTGFAKEMIDKELANVSSQIRRLEIETEEKPAREKIQSVMNEMTRGLGDEEANWLTGYVKGRVDEIVRTVGEDSEKTANQRLEVMQMLLENKESLQKKARVWGNGMRSFGRRILKEVI